jgi:exodeoxyribonuclease VII large subunit
MANPSPPVFTISEVNRMARLALERNLPSCWIKGELSNLTRATSGHWYFSIKDATASARCVMFRPRNQFVDWQPREGEQIEIRAQASLYEPRGDFQLNVEAMRHAGQGDLFEAFLRLKEKLQQAGLFEPQRKKPIPGFPQRIAIVTSPQAAALRDVLTTLSRRWPVARIVIYPCLVQGDAAPRQIIHAIQEANQRQNADVLLLVRGGGSLEDLWAFNSEDVAQAIAASLIPVVTGIGHETDFSIADFVADSRAPTPTGAAQIASPDIVELIQRVEVSKARLVRSFRSRLDTAWQQRDHLQRRLRHPHERLQHQHKQLAHLSQRLILARHHQLAAHRARLIQLRNNLLTNSPTPTYRHERVIHLRQRLRQALVHQQAARKILLATLASHLGHLCPSQVLKRGYGIVRTPQGEVVVSSSQVSIGQHLNIELALGQLGVDVIDKN